MKKATGERGSAVLMAVVVTFLIAGLTAAYLVVSTTSSKYTAHDRLGLEAVYCAETGVAVAIAAINGSQVAVEGGSVADLPVGAQDGVWDPDDLPGILRGTVESGTFETTIALWGFDGVDNNGDGQVDEGAEQNVLTVTSRASVGTEVRQIETVLSRAGSSIFKNALYAGNSSGDPSYGLTLKGQGLSADSVEGDVYVNGDLAVTEGATVNGNVTVSPGNSATGVSDVTEDTIPPYDLPGMRYHDPAAFDPGKHVDVLSNFGKATYGSAPVLGGPAGKTYQITDSKDPAHIWRKNPNDRTAETGSTQGDDFFLEDPFERINSTKAAGKAATKISLAGGYTDEVVYYLGKPGANTNMWLHNKSTLNFVWNTPGAEAAGQKMVIVVKGDIYISDSLFYLNQNKDMTVLIALKNEDGTGGNIYLGDPAFGTVEEFNCMLYAENNVEVKNVSATNSTVVVKGNLAAGNQLKGTLDYGKIHHKLSVTLDPRIRDGKFSSFEEKLLPKNPESAAGAFSIVMWRQVSPNQTAAQTGSQP